jgi:hypothetical protein
MKTAALLSIALLAACSGGSGYITGANAPDLDASLTVRSALRANPGSITFQSGKPRKVTVTQPGYTGSFSKRDTCNPFAGEIAAVTSGTASPGSATYIVTPVGAGTCAITVRDKQGKSVNVVVKVTTAAVTVQ